ncbi:hypothetical protein MNB_ARC-1_1250 [hydrothermal vent metagenome]|uniref:Uncharacterized protein n=1 Tax=hydrothermal vent metagenome TaxID=652676 RepID=A0A3B1EAA1_9ZZZZ
MNSVDKITICFCEGSHDTAFLYRILKTKCYETFKDSLYKLPKVIGDFIIQNNKNVEYNKLKINSLTNEFVPNKILYKEDEMILLYSMGGDTKKDKLLKTIQHYFEDIESKLKDGDNNGKAFDISQKTIEYKFLFFYDADNDKQKQIDKVNSILNDLNINLTLAHNKVIKKDDYCLGAYIFSNDEDKGTLEDILFELMKKDNEEIFNEAEKYLNFVQDDRLKRFKIKCKDNVSTEKRDEKQKLYEKKSIFGIVGQLQNSGASNVVTIEYSDYLTLEKINTSKKLQEIANFITTKGNI